MNNHTLLAAMVFVLSSFCGYAQTHDDNQEKTTAASKTNSQIIFEKTEYDFGEFKASDGTQHGSFKYENPTDTTITITLITTPCDCITVEWNKKPVKPGEKGELKITYANEFGAVLLHKNIFIYTSATVRPIILKVKGIATE